MRPVEFDIQTPCTRDVLEQQIAASRARGLPEISRPVGDIGRISKLTLVANGPSAIRAPLRRANTMATNGALRLFTRKGLAPTYWIGCDPQAMVAAFLKDAPAETTYLVASKCHPSVFDALQNRRVLVWHIDDVPGVVGLPATVPCATSVTLCALSVARLLGYRNIETWGWDGCFWGRHDHASPQAHAGERITNIVGRESFPTTPTWCAEAQDASIQIPGADYRVTIKGGGMIGAVLKLQARELAQPSRSQSGLSNRPRPLAA